jgi:hypothetical protein
VRAPWGLFTRKEVACQFFLIDAADLLRDWRGMTIFIWHTSSSWCVPQTEVAIRRPSVRSRKLARSASSCLPFMTNNLLVVSVVGQLHLEENAQGGRLTKNYVSISKARPNPSRSAPAGAETSATANAGQGQQKTLCADARAEKDRSGDSRRLSALSSLSPPEAFLLGRRRRVLRLSRAPPLL